MSMTSQCAVEISELITRAEVLARGTPSDRQQSSVLLSRVKNLRLQECSSDELRARYCEGVLDQAKAALGDKRVSPEAYERAFHAYILNGTKALTAEQRSDLTAGSQSISYGLTGVAGGYTVPIITESEIRASLKAVDPLLSSDVSDFVMSDSPTQRPITISQYDLSSISSYLITETSYTSPASFPGALAATLAGNKIYKAGPLAASIESLQDVPEAVGRMAEAFGVALGRGISEAVTTGNGVNDAQGLLTAISTRVLATTPGKITFADVSNTWFSLDSFWRSRPQMAWIASDSVVQRLRQIEDNSGRPILRASDGDRQVRLFGAPIYTSPSLPVVGGSIGGNSVLLLGDMSQFHIRMSKPVMSRSINQSGTKGIEYGQALFACRARVDSVYIDSSSGNSPSIICATVTA